MIARPLASPMMIAVGIDLKTCPVPIGTALERIPKILPSHEARHDPLLRGEPWFRKVAFPTAMSHGLVTLGVMLHILLLDLLQIMSRMPLLRRAILWVMVMQRILVRAPMAKRPLRTILRRLISSRSMRRRRRRTWLAIARLSLSCAPLVFLAFLEVSTILTQFFPLWVGLIPWIFFVMPWWRRSG